MKLPIRDSHMTYTHVILNRAANQNAFTKTSDEQNTDAENNQRTMADAKDNRIHLGCSSSQQTHSLPTPAWLHAQEWIGVRIRKTRDAHCPGPDDMFADEDELSNSERDRNRDEKRREGGL